MSRAAAIIGTAILLLGITPGALFADQIPWSTLKQSCNDWLEDADNRDDGLCQAYVSGYLAGANFAPYSTRAKEPVSQSETYTDRAIRTRTNEAMMNRAQASDGSVYCLGDNTGPDEIARVIGEYTAPEEIAGQDTGELVKKALAAGFPCDA